MIKMYPDNEHLLLDSNTISDYIHGGRGIVKLEAPSGTHHFYMYAKPVQPDEFPDDVVFVYAIHEQSTKFYLGMIEQGKFRLTKHSRFLPDTDIVKGAMFIDRLSRDNGLVKRTPMKLYHMGVCARCGRKLTSLQSLLEGYGPRCRRRKENEHFATD